MTGCHTIHLLLHRHFHQSILYPKSKQSIVLIIGVLPPDSATMFYMKTVQLFLLFQFIPHRQHTHTHTHKTILEYGLCHNMYLANNTATIVTMVTQHITKQLGSQPKKERKKKRKKERKKKRKKERKEKKRKEREGMRKVGWMEGGREGWWQGREEGGRKGRREGGNYTHFHIHTWCETSDGQIM